MANKSVGESDNAPIRSGRDFCKRYTPKRHAARECSCFPKRTGILVIQPRSGRQIRVLP